MKVVESNEGKSGWEIPPKDVKGGTRVLGRTNNVHYRGVKRKGWRNMDLNDDERVVVNCRAPLKVVKRTNKERGSSESGVES